VYFSAHVTAVDDSIGMLAEKAGAPISVGQVVSGQYRYDTSTPNMNPMAPDAFYNPPPGAAAIRISMGSLAFQTDPQGIVGIGLHTGPVGDMFLDSLQNLAAPGFNVQDIRVHFQDPTGHAPASVALPTDVPDLTSFTTATVTVTGNGLNPAGMGDSFSVTFNIDSVYVFPPSAATWSVSPATGVFSPQQNMDAVVLLPAGSQVQSVQSFIGDVPGPFNFGGPLPPGPPHVQCSLLPQNSKGQPVIDCPGVMSALPTGVNQIDWHVQLVDGTTLDKVVVWEVVP